MTFDNTRISEIIIPDGVTSIGASAFNICRSLTRVKLPAKLNEMGSGVFGDCSALASITLPETLTEIPSSCFNGCSSLKRILIPASVKTVYYDAFANCTNLKDFVFASGSSASLADYSIGYKKLSNTYTKYTDITLWAPGGSNVDTYAKNHEFNFRPVSEYTGSWSEPNWWDTGSSDPTPAAVGAKVVSKNAADKSTYKVTSSNAKNPTVAYTGTSNKSAASISVPKTVTDKNGIVYKVTKIEKNALKGNKKVKKLTIGANVTEIGASAFEGMVKLENVDFAGSKVKTIGKKAFYGCKVLKQVKANGNTLAKVGAQSFKGIKKKAKILIFAANKKKYNKVVSLIKKSKTGKVRYVFKKN